MLNIETVQVELIVRNSILRYVFRVRGAQVLQYDFGRIIHYVRLLLLYDMSA